MPDALTDIYNYRPISDALATSGQPTESQFVAIASAGYELVINLALHNDPKYSLPDERKTVCDVGMQYVHIPVQFKAPTRMDLDQFCAVMDSNAGRKIWVHCAANMRVTAFLGLYRVRLGWTEKEAFESMSSVWNPNAVWAAFIADQIPLSAG